MQHAAARNAADRRTEMPMGINSYHHHVPDEHTESDGISRQLKTNFSDLNEVLCNKSETNHNGMYEDDNFEAGESGQLNSIQGTPNHITHDEYSHDFESSPVSNKNVAQEIFEDTPSTMDEKNGIVPSSVHLSSISSAVKTTSSAHQELISILKNILKSLTKPINFIRKKLR